MGYQFSTRRCAKVSGVSNEFMFLNLRFNIDIVSVYVLCGFTSLIYINAGVCVSFT
jgi:hypothetical protein